MHTRTTSTSISISCERHVVPPVGTTARRSRTLTFDDIERFTEITGDRNPLHYDHDAATASRFGGIIQGRCS